MNSSLKKIINNILEFMTASKVSEVLNFSYYVLKLCFLKARGFLDEN